MTYRVYLFFKLIRNRLGKGLAKFEILEPYVSPHKLGNNWASQLDPISSIGPAPTDNRRTNFTRWMDK